MKAERRRHTDEVVPKLVSPEPVVDEVRGVESEEGEDERTEDEESAEEDGGGEVPVDPNAMLFRHHMSTLLGALGTMAYMASRYNCKKATLQAIKIVMTPSTMAT